MPNLTKEERKLLRLLTSLIRCPPKDEHPIPLILKERS